MRNGLMSPLELFKARRLMQTARANYRPIVAALPTVTFNDNYDEFTQSAVDVSLPYADVVWQTYSFQGRIIWIKPTSLGSASFGTLTVTVETGDCVIYVRKSDKAQIDRIDEDARAYWFVDNTRVTLDSVHPYGLFNNEELLLHLKPIEPEFIKEGL